MDEIYLEFLGWQPEWTEHKRIHGTLRNTLNQAPSGARMDVAVKRTRSGFQTTCLIRSKVKRFFAVGKGRHYQASLKDAMQKTQKQIDHWKTARFRHPKTYERTG